MEPVTLLAIQALGGATVVGGAYGAVKTALNGTKERVKELEKDSKDAHDRLARIETKLDFLVERSQQG